MSLALRPLTQSDAAAAAALHAAGFADPWSASSIAELIAQPTVLALGAEASGALIAFVLFQSAAGDTELLTIATDPARRGEGHAHRLIEAGFTALAAGGNTRVLLDVAEDNAPALHLYTSLGFKLDGRRKAYYTAGRPAPVDALLMSRPLSG
jgi:[ribosomal protein S18]-alanine N-acetyltransferase